MKVSDFLKLYSLDPTALAVGARLNPATANTLRGAADKADASAVRLHLRGLVGSQDAVLAAALHQEFPDQHHLFILHDRDEAAYFLADLQHLVPEEEPLLFPTSYKRPYSFDETENANVLMRAEVLNKLNSHRGPKTTAEQAADDAEEVTAPENQPKGKKRVKATAKETAGALIVTYPEALFEKVINKKSLVANTFLVKVGDKLDVNFVSDMLAEYDFERSDFVYEAGQFAVRGGIVDIFSYANELPYRIELFGDEVETIRTFDPESQLSVEKRQQVSIIRTCKPSCSRKHGKPSWTSSRRIPCSGPRTYARPWTW